MPRKISPHELIRSVGTDRYPIIVDVRRPEAFAASPVRIADDLRQLERGMPLYDALYGWCRFVTAETHNWPAKAS